MDSEKIKKFETNDEFVDFIIGFINGKEGKILNIEKTDNRCYKLYLEEGYYTLEYCLVYLSDFRNGKQVALHYEHGPEQNGYRIAITSRLLREEIVQRLFKAVDDIYTNNLPNAIKNSREVLSAFIQILKGYDFINKVNDNIFELKKGEVIHVFICSNNYKNGQLSHVFNIYHNDKSIANYETNSNAISSLFNCLNLFASSGGVNLNATEEITDITACIDKIIIGD